MKAWSAIVLSALVLLAVWYVAGGTALINTPHYLHDFWSVGGALWRASAGDVPHVDVHTPVGRALFWLFAAAAWLAGPSVRAMLLASALVALAALGLAWAILGRERPRWLWLAAGVFAFAAALSPRWMDADAPFLFSHMAPYNRWGWALVALPALYAFAPPGGVRPNLAGGALSGLVVAFLVLLKITYGIVAAGFLGLALLARNRDLREIGAAAAAALLALLAAGLVSGTFGAYLADIRLAIAANDGLLLDRLRARPDLVRWGVLHGAAAAAVLGLAAWALRQRGAGLAGIAVALWRPVLFVAALGAGGLALAVQNHPRTEAPFFAVAVIAAFAWSAPHLAGGGAARHLARGAALALLALALVGAPGRDLAHVAAHRVMAAGADAAAVPELQDTPFAGLRLPRAVLETAGAPEPAGTAEDRACRRRYGQNASQLRRMLDGLEAAARLAPEDAVVFPLGVFNGYYAARGTAAPRGGLWWHDPGRTFSTAHHLPAAAVFDGVDVVLRSAACHREVSEYFWTIYGDHLDETFREVGQTPIWRVYLRRDLDPPAL